MTSQLNVALVGKLHGSFRCAWCYSWVFVQPCTDRRPVAWCRNQMSELYIPGGSIVLHSVLHPQHNQSDISFHRSSTSFGGEVCLGGYVGNDVEDVGGFNE